MSVERPGIVHLELGTKVDGKWSVIEKLGEGTFGAVYKVKMDNGTDEFALKTEHIQQKYLLLEMKVMQMLSELKAKNCCLMEDKGRVDPYNYVVMKLVGQSLQDAKKTGPNQHLSIGCALSVSIQCLEGLKELHATGFMHRDIKPGNYAVGLPEKNELRRIYLLDFGMCKLFHTSVAEYKQKAKFRGTPRYAPIASHKRIEHARKEDLESWLYMVIDFCTAALPWKVTTNMTEIGEMKEKCRQTPLLEQMMTGVPLPVLQILGHIDGLGCMDIPNYEWIVDTLNKTIKDGKHEVFPYDWEKVAIATEIKAKSPSPNDKFEASVVQSTIDPQKRFHQSKTEGGQGTETEE